MTVRVVFVAGTGRSGSTVFELALAQRLAVPSSGELVSVWTRGVIEGRRCSCGEPFARCPLWQSVVATDPPAFTVAVAERVASASARVLRAFGPLRCLTGRQRARLVAMVGDEWFGSMAALYRGVAVATGSDIFTDSSKAPALAILLSQIDGLRLDVVHLVRDPRAVARSWSHPHAVPPETAPMPSLVPWKSALVWGMVNEAAGRVQSVVNGARVAVRYEDFARCPSIVLDQTATVLGFPPAAPADQPVIVGPAAHTMSGNPPVRLRREPVTVEPVARSGAGGGSAFEDALVSGLTLPLLGRYGYPLGTSQDRR